jgi:hypothetical protein
MLQELHLDVLEHPPHSPDLTPSDNHLFGSFKNALRGHCVVSDNRLKKAVHI